MMVATVRNNTDFAQVAALRADEKKRLEVLRSEGRIGAHHVAPALRATFVEVIAADEKQVEEMRATLPLAQFFDLDIYSTTPPDTAEPAHRATS
jgi:muconolactone delta-isomerase